MLPAGQDPVAAPAVGERAGVARVVQDPQHGVVGQRLPVGLAFAGPGPVPPGERQPVGPECLHHGGRRPGGLERGEQPLHGAAHGGVGVEDDVPGGVVDDPTGSGMTSSPRRALDSCPPRSRARMKWSSASLICPFMPSTAGR